MPSFGLKATERTADWSCPPESTLNGCKVTSGPRGALASGGLTSQMYTLPSVEPTKSKVSSLRSRLQREKRPVRTTQDEARVRGPAHFTARVVRQGGGRRRGACVVPVVALETGDNAAFKGVQNIVRGAGRAHKHPLAVFAKGAAGVVRDSGRRAALRQDGVVELHADERRGVKVARVVERDGGLEVVHDGKHGAGVVEAGHTRAGRFELALLVFGAQVPEPDAAVV